MTYDRAIRALLNGKAIRRDGYRYIRIGQTETEHWLEGPSGYAVASLIADIEWLTADDWECGSYDPKTKKVTWDNVVYDGHENPIDRLPLTSVKQKESVA